MPRPWKHIFGPVPSRRLGRSLGIDVIPKKICTLDCIYCEVGRTTRSVVARKEYVSPGEVREELAEALTEGRPIDWITFSGSGEPTLNSALGGMIHSAKEMTDTPVAVITNGTLLFLPEVRNGLLEADLVLPSLDAASGAVFRKVNRPHRSLSIDQIIGGLQLFRREYAGQIWLEILLVKGVNDGDGEIRRLWEAIDLIQPDKIQLNTIVRPPAEPDAQPVGQDRLDEIRLLLGNSCEIIASSGGGGIPNAPAPRIDCDSVLALLRRRPVTFGQIAAAFGGEGGAALAVLDRLEELGLAEQVTYDGLKYYSSTRLS